LMTCPKTCAKKSSGFWTRIINGVIIMLLGKVVNDVAIVYATLIVKGRKTFAQVPASLKEEVRQILIDLDCEHLIVE